MNWADIWEIVLEPVRILFDPSQRLAIYYQITALIFAVAGYVIHQARTGQLHPVGLLRWLVPREVVLHPSAVTDYGFYLANKMLMALIYGSIILGSLFWHHVTLDLLVQVFGPMGPGFPASFWLTLFCTVVLLTVMDATLWAVHYLFHVVPVLWEFHKVHHSAEVMTPLTAARMHPVEEVFDATVSGFTTGVAFALLTYTLGPSAAVWEVFKQNIFMIVFFVIAFNLRHSHVWLRYPDWVQRIFICPAQHQIHHSRAPEHWDRNMGFIFSVWDWMAGTLVIARKGQTVSFGLGTAEDGTWRSVGVLYWRPFRQSWAVLRRQLGLGGAAVAAGTPPAAPAREPERAAGGG